MSRFGVEQPPHRAGAQAAAHSAVQLDIRRCVLQVGLGCPSSKGQTHCQCHWDDNTASQLTDRACHQGKACVRHCPHQVGRWVALGGIGIGWHWVAFPPAAAPGSRRDPALAADFLAAATRNDKFMYPDNSEDL